MNVRVLAGVSLATVALGVGVLAGSIVGGASAQTTTPTAPGTGTTTTPPSTSQPPSNSNPGPGAPGNFRPFMGGGPGMGMGMDGPGMGMGGPGMGGPGMGGPGMRGFEGRGPGGPGPGATADTAKNVIDRVTTQITTVKGDLAYATGKMDTTSVQRWLNGADSLLKSAQASSTATKYEQAQAYARAANDLAGIAENQMGQTLGFDKLPSASQRPQFPGKGNQPTKPAITQAQASRILARTYDNLVMQKAVLKDGGDVATYLAEAQNAYKTAYDAYNAGKYGDAVTSTRLAEQLAGVASQIHYALSATGSSDAPVTVPAPNF